MSATLVPATPLLFTGLAAAAAFRMQLFNIGGEGQLYLGAIGGPWIALKLGDHGVDVDALLRLCHVRRGRGARRLLGADPRRAAGVRAHERDHHLADAQLRAGLLLTYLIFDSASYWRDISTLQARAFPTGKAIPTAAEWPTFGSASSSRSAS